MKKVLLTINNNKLSGIEKFAVLLAKYSDKTKYNIEIGIPAYGPLCKTLEENNISYFIFDNKKTGKHTISGIKSMFYILKKNKYDIIHAQAGIVPCIIGKILGTKLIIEHKHGLDFTTEQINDMNIFSLIYERLKKFFVDMTFTVCEADKMTLISKFNYQKSKVKVIYNGIENKLQESDNKKSLKFTIGTIGRLTYQKGQEYFIEMAKILTDRGFDFEYFIYGAGEKLKEYEELIIKYNITDRVFLKGYTNNVSEVLNSFDLFVLSSRYEGIPYVLLEAMKESIPVISTDVGGIKEVINDNSNGLLVKKENASELAARTIELYNSSEKRAFLSGNAKKDFEEKFTVEKTISDIESGYSEIFK